MHIIIICIYICIYPTFSVVCNSISGVVFFASAGFVAASTISISSFSSAGTCLKIRCRDEEIPGNFGRRFHQEKKEDSPSNHEDT